MHMSMWVGEYCRKELSREQCTLGAPVASLVHMMGAGCSASGSRPSSTCTTSRWPGRAVVGPAAYRPGR